MVNGVTPPRLRSPARFSEPEDSDRAESEQRSNPASASNRERCSATSAVVAEEHVSLRQLTQASFARRREGLTSQRSMMAALAPLLDAEKITETADGDYLLNAAGL